MCRSKFSVVAFVSYQTIAVVTRDVEKQLKVLPELYLSARLRCCEWAKHGFFCGIMSVCLSASQYVHVCMSVQAKIKKNYRTENGVDCYE